MTSGLSAPRGRSNSAGPFGDNPLCNFSGFENRSTSAHALQLAATFKELNETLQISKGITGDDNTRGGANKCAKQGNIP
jgi:hypothetical protein